MAKKIVLGAVILLVLFVAYRASQIDATNLKVADDIRSNPDGERAMRTMIVTLQDGRVYPVNYLREDGLVFMGIDGLWWREFTGEGQPIEMFIRGEILRGHAVAETEDQAYVDDIFSRLRPTVPAWLPDWLNGKLVVITPE